MDMLTVKEAAERLSISPQTLRRWSVKGIIPVVTLPSGHRRYPSDVIDALTTPDNPTSA